MYVLYVFETQEGQYNSQGLLELNLSPINFNTRQSEFAQCNSSICCQGDFKLIFKFQQQDVNTLTTDEDYSRENRENLSRTLQTQ